MSTAKADSTADPKATPGADLTAEAVKAALQCEPVSAYRDYRFTVSLCEKFGRAFISWSLDPNYAVGVLDTVILMEKGTAVRQQRVAARLAGEFDTGHAWGSGLNASYWASHGKTNPGPNDWRRLVVTPDTTAD